MGTVTFISTFGREPPEDKVPQPTATTFPEGVEPVEARFAAWTYVLKVKAVLTRHTATSLARVFLWIISKLNAKFKFKFKSPGLSNFKWGEGFFSNSIFTHEL